jgi:hypothetical protein
MWFSEDCALNTNDSPEYANTTSSARPIDFSPWKTTEELLYPVEHWIVWSVQTKCSDQGSGANIPDKDALTYPKLPQKC